MVAFFKIGNLDGLSLVIGIGFMMLLFLFSALISGSEVAYFSLSPQQMAALKQEDSATGSRIYRLLQKPEILLATILIANNLVNIALVIFSFFFTEHLTANTPYSDLAPMVNAIITTVLLVLLGEVMPKVYATHHNLSLARFTSLPLSIINRILRPFSRLLAYSTHFIEQKVDGYRSKKGVNMEELNNAIDLVASASNGKTELQDIEMLKGLVEFRDIIVRQIMCSRVDMFAINKAISFKELVEKVTAQGYSRVPIFEEDIDNIVGILYVKDLLEYLDAPDNFDWSDLVKDAYFIPETMKIDILLKQMQKERRHLAIVVDEYSGTAGLITLEDILEEIVGEIIDEHDDEESGKYKKRNRYNYEFDGRTTVHDMCKVMKIDPQSFYEINGDYDSVAGLLLEINQNFPKENDKIKYKRFEFTVLKKDGNRIDTVLVNIKPSEMTNPVR